MKRVYNFSPGPSTLPLPVLEKASKGIIKLSRYRHVYYGDESSVQDLQDIVDSAQELLMELMDIPKNYKVLFLQGGATTQFSMVPLNLFSKYKKADYAITGNFAKKAAQDAQRYGQVNIVASSEDQDFSYIPDVDSMKASPDSIISILLPTTLSMEQGLLSCPIQEMFLWWQICPPTFYLKFTMYQNLALFMQVPRKILHHRVLLL